MMPGNDGFLLRILRWGRGGGLATSTQAQKTGIRTNFRVIGQPVCPWGASAGTGNPWRLRLMRVDFFVDRTENRP
jgi:hypothetical protein